MSSQNKKMANWQATLNRIAAAEARHKATSSAAAPPADTMPPMPPPPAAPVVAPDVCVNCSEQGKCGGWTDAIQCLKGLYVMDVNMEHKVYKFKIVKKRVDKGNGLIYNDHTYELYINNINGDEKSEIKESINSGKVESLYEAIENQRYVFKPNENAYFSQYAIGTRLPHYFGTTTFFKGGKPIEQDIKRAIEKYETYAKKEASNKKDYAECIENFKEKFHRYLNHKISLMPKIDDYDFKYCKETLKDAKERGLLPPKYFTERPYVADIRKNSRERNNAPLGEFSIGSYFSGIGGGRRSSKTKRARRSKRKGTRRN